MRARALAGSAVVAAWGLLGGLAGGCGEPVADVVAVWVDGVADDEGNRRVRIYEAGERDVLSIVPDIPNSGIELLQIGVDGRARGFAVSATDATVWIERGSGRSVTLSAAEVGRKELVAPGFTFTRNGDAILRALEVDASLPPAWLFAPLSGPGSLQVQLVGPPTVAAPERRWTVHHAADAPVLVWAEARGTPSAVDGRILALAYPSEEGQGPVVEGLRPLARGSMRGEGSTSADPRYLAGCAEGLCVSPSGRMLYAIAEEGACDLVRWSWVAAESSEADTPAQTVALPCPTDAETTQLVAALGDEHVVLDDGLRLHLVHLPSAEPGTDDEPPPAPTVTSLPKPAGLLVPYLVAHGQVLVVSSQQGEVARVDVEGPRMVSGTQASCVLRDGFAVSPGGAWVVQSCNGQSDAPSGVDGQIQRISVLGSELYVGLPMRPIAVDDEGNALLYSVASDDDDGVPRGLFVLTGDGQLTRVDELEPFPGRVLVGGNDGQAVPGRFAASGPG